MTQREATEYDQYVTAMKQRTKAFALRVIGLVRTLQRDHVARTIGGQLLRCGTSVGANYRAACRVRTAPEFVAKLRIVLEEADESQFWLELLIEAAVLPSAKLQPLHDEASELVAIFTRALDTATRKARS